MSVSSRRLKYLRNLSIYCLLLGVACMCAFGQSQTGSLSGEIRDVGNAAVPGAAVDATLTSAGVTLHTVSSEAGVYVFPSLPPGEWTVSAEKQGFKKSVRTGIQIFIAQRQSLDIQLELGDVKQSV